MKFSYHPSMCNPSFYLELGKAAEDAGFDVITFPDSICYPKECDSTYPYNDDGSREFLDGVPFLEPFSIIPAIAALTEKLEFSTSVYKLAPRQAVTTAKFVTTLGVMTNNRFHFGIGVSPWYEDFLATGERWEKRGKRMDEQITILRGLMDGDYFGFKGDFYDIPDLKLCPVPSQPVPILIGGHSKLALKRAAKLGDGWISAGISLEETKLDFIFNSIDSILLPSFHAVSPGKIKVAIFPGFTFAYLIASAPSIAISFEDLLVFTQWETGLAIPSISEVNGAFNFI